MSNRTDWLLLM